MKHTNYDIMVAINLRANGTGELLFDTMGNPRPVDFRTSIEAARDQMFLYGYYYPGEDILQVMKRPQTTKQEWKEIHHGYRYYCWSMSMEILQEMIHDGSVKRICPKCGGTLRHEQNFHVVNLVCNNCDNDIRVMPVNNN